MQRTEQRTHPPISVANFQVYRKNGALPRDVIKAFLVKKMIGVNDVLDGIFTFEHNVYKLIVSDEILAKLRETEEVYCLISFQIRTHGKYAIAIMYKPEKALKLDTKG